MENTKKALVGLSGYKCTDTAAIEAFREIGRANSAEWERWQLTKKALCLQTAGQSKG